MKKPSTNREEMSLEGEVAMETSRVSVLSYRRIEFEILMCYGCWRRFKVYGIYRTKLLIHYKDSSLRSY